MAADTPIGLGLGQNRIGVKVTDRAINRMIGDK